jgi:hypothetical protein
MISEGMHRSVALAACLASAACTKPPAPAKAPAPQPAAGADGRQLVFEGAVDGSIPPTLALTIDAAYEHQQPGLAPPWHAPGGDWTFLEMHTPAGAPLTVGFGERSPFEQDGISVVQYVGLLAPSDRTSGAAFAEELGRTLGVDVPTPLDERPLGALVFSLIAFSEHTAKLDHAFSGTGNWMAGKWIFDPDDDEQEIFFNVSLDEKRAELSEKDPSYDAGVVRDFAYVLRDGIGKEDR